MRFGNTKRSVCPNSCTNIKIRQQKNLLRGVFMTVLFIILGILLIGCGFSCIFTPLLTFMNAGYFVVIMIAVVGIVGIVKGIAKKQFGINFVFSILSALLGIVMVLFPGSLLLAETVMLIMTAVWFVMMGIVTIINAVSAAKAKGSKIWILQLIFGILAVLIGGYSFFHPMLVAVSLGVLIGIFFIETGCNLLFSGIAFKD